MRVTIVAISLAGILTSSPQLLRGAEKSQTMPAPPAPPSNAPSARVDFFRQLVSMTSAERAVALASRTEQDRKIIYSRLQEFDQLSPEEREMRLQRMKLRYQLVPLLVAPTSERQTLLSLIPE